MYQTFTIFLHCYFYLIKPQLKILNHTTFLFIFPYSLKSISIL